jgi:hypothetical protein
MTGRRDPVFFKLEGPAWHRQRRWYFWNETWSDHYGPFDSEAEARRSLAEYAAKL